jgi:uncharacterized protein
MQRMNELKPHPENHLAGSLSPYLLQHLHNPVDWYPWNEKTLEKAKAENKLLIISIGYAACHWCHVMEHESFSDSEVAALMNEHFICIKVDREERPDIDQVYMDAVQLMTKRGGWPLNCIALPDGRPIYGGTYFPKENWMDLLSQLAHIWKQDPGKTIQYATELTNALQADENAQPLSSASLNQKELDTLIQQWMGRMDKVEGGENREPKFPMPANWRLLMRAGHLSENESILKQVKLTLDKMALGGIYDQVGGGFARYSTDTLWHVPHFEKMLYDNAQLISLYSEAFTCFREPLYETVVRETIDFMKRELHAANGGWFSSLDADSEGVEGKFYVWKKQEIEIALGEDSAWFCRYFHVTDNGNWEYENNVLIAAESPEAFALHSGIGTEILKANLVKAKAKLLSTRSSRIRPGLDDKIIAGWNGLMVRGLCDAWLALGDDSFIGLARNTFHFLETEMMRGEKLLRCHRNGETHINGFLDDYALVADGALALFQCTGEIHFLQSATALCDYALSQFEHNENPLLYYTAADDAPLIVRKKETNDNVIPAANSVMATNLQALNVFTGNSEYQKRAAQMAASVKAGFLHYPGAYAHWGALLIGDLFPKLEIVVSGPNVHSVLLSLGQHYYPGAYLLPLITDLEIPLAQGRFSTEKNQIYICKDRTCRLPVNTVEEALIEMAKLQSEK